MQKGKGYRIYYLNFSWKVLYDLRDVRHGFDDATMWHDDDDIYVYVLYDDSHKGFHLGFIDFHSCFTMMVT